MEKQAPIGYTRSMAFASKEDLELHWGDRCGKGEARLRRQSKQTYSQVYVSARIPELGGTATNGDGEGKRELSAASALLAKAKLRRCKQYSQSSRHSVSGVERLDITRVAPLESGCTCIERSMRY